MLTAVSVAQECGFIAYGERVIVVSTVEKDGMSHVEFHAADTGAASGAADNVSEHLNGKMNGSSMLDLNGVSVKPFSKPVIKHP